MVLHEIRISKYNEAMANHKLGTIVREITYGYKRRMEIFRDLELKERAEVLLRLSKQVQEQVLDRLTNEEIRPILEYVEPDDATDLLQSLGKKRQETLVTELSEGLQEKLSTLLSFDPRTAAGLMSLNYIQVEDKEKLKMVAEEMQRHEKRTGKVPEILIVRDGVLLGFLPTQELIFAKPGEEVAKYLKKLRVIKGSATHKELTDDLLEHPHEKMVVLDENQAILGVIYADDVLRIIKGDEAKSLYDFAGVSEEETVFGSVKQKVRFRYRWLMFNLGTAFLSAFAVSLFEETIAKYVLLAVYMPIVAEMGGNAGTQAFAVLVRGIALKQIELRAALPVLRRELTAGLFNGVINGILVGGIVLGLNRDWRISVILGSAMIINLLVGVTFGTMVPLVLAKFKKDPATSGGIFITTATDVLGFMAYLGIATLLLR